MDCPVSVKQSFDHYQFSNLSSCNLTLTYFYFFSSKTNYTRPTNEISSMKPPIAPMDSPRTYHKPAATIQNNVRQNSVEPSITLTPARYGSVGREEGFEFPAKSWRSLIREQQIAENRKLIESVKSRSNSASREINENNSNSRYNSVQGKVYDNHKHLKWLPVHEHAMKNGSNENDLKDSNNNIYLAKAPKPYSYDRSVLTTTNSTRREFSEPPLLTSSGMH